MDDRAQWGNEVMRCNELSPTSRLTLASLQTFAGCEGRDLKVTLTEAYRQSHLDMSIDEYLRGIAEGIEQGYLKPNGQTLMIALPS